MGVIIRQSIKQSIVAYLAIAVAVVAQLFIYPIDDFATYGLAQAIIALAMLLYPLIVLGVPQAMIKFFNEFYKKSEGYLLNFLILSIALMVFFGTLIYFFYGSFLRMLDHLEISQALFIDYGTTVVVLVVLLILLRIFITQAANFHRIVWPAIFENLWTKFALAMAVLLVVSGSLNQDSLAYTIPIYFGVALFGMFIYLTFLGVQNWQYNPTLFKKDVLKSILRYAAYTGLSSFGVMLAIRIDQIMVPNMVDYQSNGIYSFFIFMTAVIEIPARSIVQISSPILSKAHENLDYKEIQKIYSKSASILLIFGLGLFLLIFLNLDDIFAIMGKSSLLGGLVALFAILGVAKIFTLIFYVAPQIIMYSKYYRFILYVTITLGVLNTVLNYWFIRDVFATDPLIGASIATAISIVLYNCILAVFIRIRFKANPLHWKMIAVLIIAALCFGLAMIIPETSNPFLDIIIRSSIFVIPFIFAIYKTKASEDFNQIINQLIRRIKDRDFKDMI